MLCESNRFLCEQAFLQSDLYLNSDSLLLYASTKSESDTFNLINNALEDNKIIYLPKVHGDIMKFYQISTLDDLSDGYFSIKEPTTDVEYDNRPAVCVVPGLAFDLKGNRLGYGKGYYDKFFQQTNEIIKVGFCAGCNYYNKIPCDETDIPMNYLIVDSNIIGL